MIRLFKVRMSPHASAHVEEVLNSGFVGQGPKVEKFEAMLKDAFQTKGTPVTTNSCTAALDLALLLCGVGPGDEVISSPADCFAGNTVMINRGARIRWADVDPSTFNIDPKSVEKLITPKTKAIMAVDWAGRLCDFKTLKSFGIPVIEDAAHCWDSFIVDRDNAERGNFIAYSLQAIKFCTASDGGFLITDDPELEHRARLLRWFGLDRTKGASFRCAQNVQVAGLKYHMNDVAAAIGIENVYEANDSVTKHRRTAKLYCESINNPALAFPAWDENCSYWLFSLSVEKGTVPAFIDYMKDNGIECSPVHYRNDDYDVTKPFKEKVLPGVESFAAKQVSIPVGWWLSDEDKAKVIEACNAWSGWA